MGVKYPPSKGGPKNWLLVTAQILGHHRADPAARYTTVVSTDRSFAEIAGNAPAPTFGHADPLPLPPAEPMLARLVDAPPLGHDWLHKIKIGGSRGLVHLGQGGTVIRTRIGWTGPSVSPRWSLRWPNCRRGPP